MTTKGYESVPVGAHNEFFAGLNELLKEKGSGHPVIVLDLDRLDRNISELKKKITTPKNFRVVVNSGRR